MTSWADMPLLAFDCESTSTDPFTARIVEVATVLIDRDGTARDPWSTIVNPGIEIPADAASVHGITTERAVAEGVEPQVALREIAERIWHHLGQHAACVAYNARYDVPLLLAESERHGVEFPCFASVLDPYLLDRLCDRYRPGKRQLALVAEHYEVDLLAAHGALADATAAGQVMRAIVARFPELADRTLASLWLHQAHGHEQDRQRFEDYLRRNVDKDAHVIAGWPVPVEAGR